MEKLTSLSSHTKPIVEKVFSDKGFTPEETALLYHWARIVGEEYARKFSPLKIKTIDSSLNPSKKRLYIRTKEDLNPIEASYSLCEVKGRICEYFGFDLVQEIKVRKGK